MPAAELPFDLSASHDLLHVLLDVSLPGIILFRPVYAEDDPATVIDLAYVHLNPAAQQMLGLPDQPADTFCTLYPNSLETGIFGFYRDTFLSGQPGEYAVNYTHDGLNNFFRLSARRSGELLVVGFTDTATQDRSAVEQALRASQAREQAARAEAEAQRQRFYDVLMHLPAQVATYHGPQHVYQFVNARYAQFVSPHELLGRPVREAGQGAVPVEVFEMLDRVYATGEPVQLHEVEVVLDRYQAGPAEPLFIDASYLPLRDVTGRIYGVLDFSYDVTEQVLARRQVQQLNQELEARVQERTRQLAQAQLTTEHQRQRLERLLWEAPAAVAITAGPDMVFEFFNPLFAALFEERPQLGLSVLEALPELRDQEAWHTMCGVYATGRTHQADAIHVPLRRERDGLLEDRYFNYIQQARYNERGQIDGVLVFAFEATEQVRARQQVQALNQALSATNQELHESNRQLTRTNVDLDTFVYTASHDLKAPISNIEGILLALRAQLPAEIQQDEMVAQLLDMLQGTVTRFQLTITQLTDITKLQLAHVGPAEPVQLAQVVEAVRQDLLPQLEQAATRLTVEVAPELVVSFSPANLRSIVYNLLSNASKYRDPTRSSQVLVRATQTTQAVVLTVQDNGLGMSELQQRQLFGLFQRLHTHVEGTGVGLYIVKRLVENGGGTIAVHSQPAVGTTFTVTIPHARG